MDEFFARLGTRKYEPPLPHQPAPYSGPEIELDWLHAWTPVEIGPYHYYVRIYPLGISLFHPNHPAPVVTAEIVYDGVGGMEDVKNPLSRIGIKTARSLSNVLFSRPNAFFAELGIDNHAAKQYIPIWFAQPTPAQVQLAASRRHFETYSYDFSAFYVTRFRIIRAAGCWAAAYRDAIQATRIVLDGIRKWYRITRRGRDREPSPSRVVFDLRSKSNLPYRNSHHDLTRDLVDGYLPGEDLSGTDVNWVGKLTDEPAAILFPGFEQVDSDGRAELVDTLIQDSSLGTRIANSPDDSALVAGFEYVGLRGIEPVGLLLHLPLVLGNGMPCYYDFQNEGVGNSVLGIMRFSGGYWRWHDHTYTEWGFALDDEDDPPCSPLFPNGAALVPTTGETGFFWKLRLGAIPFFRGGAFHCSYSIEWSCYYRMLSAFVRYYLDRLYQSTGFLRGDGWDLVRSWMSMGALRPAEEILASPVEIRRVNRFRNR